MELNSMTSAIGTSSEVVERALSSVLSGATRLLVDNSNFSPGNVDSLRA